MDSKEESIQANETVEYIREEMREMKLLERKQNREIVQEKNRTTLGSFYHPESSSINKEVIIEMGKKLKKKTLTIKEYRILQNVLIQNEENINAFLSVDNVICALVRDLSGNNTTVQLSAANCCCNIALGNSKACFSLAKNAASYIVTELDSSNSLLVEVCLWTIGNLSIGSEKAFAVLLAQNCIKHITKILKNYSCLVPAVKYALLRCLYVGLNQIEDDDIIELTKAVTKYLLRIPDSESLWLLALLSSNQTCIDNHSYFANDVIKLLYDSVQNENHDVSQVTAMIRILGNTVWESSGQVAELFLNYSTYSAEKLLQQLSTHSYTHVRKETLWLIGNIYNHRMPHIGLALQKIIPSIAMLKDYLKTAYYSQISPF